MKIALVVNHITDDITLNFSRILSAIHQCADSGVELVLFPEAAITGLVNNDDPIHDLPLGSPIPGEFTDTLTKVSLERKIYIGIGILEREDNKLYSSAVLITPYRGIALKYRRITPGWHGKDANPEIYCHGNELKKVETPLGSFAFLLCGDLFDDSLISWVRKLKPDYLLFPFARSFENGSYDQKRWDKEEKIEYIKRVQSAGVTTFMVNYLADRELDGGSFGGAMVVSPGGEIIAEIPIGTEEVLYVEI